MKKSVKVGAQAGRRRQTEVRRKRGGPRDDGASLRMALEAADMVTWEWDLRTGVIRYSGNVGALARGDAVDPYSTDAALLQTIHPADREGLARALARSRAEGCPFECEYRVRMLDGKYHWILGRGKSVVVVRGKPVRILGISQDITARKKAEEEIRRRSRQLAELASELTMVEHRERRRIAEVLHENLQQVLVAACLEAESLSASADTKVSGPGRALLKALSEALVIARGMTQELAPPVSLRRDMPTAFDWLARHMHARYKLDVSVQIHQSLKHTMESAGVLLFTAARELLLNVVKHAGTRHAVLSLRRQSGRIVLDVRDEGRGMSRNALRTRGDPQGFGLFSIRERAELLGGVLAVESAPGRGTHVVLSLPLRRQNPGRTLPPRGAERTGWPRSHTDGKTTKRTSPRYAKRAAGRR